MPAAMPGNPFAALFVKEVARALGMVHRAALEALPDAEEGARDVVKRLIPLEALTAKLERNNSSLDAVAKDLRKRLAAMAEEAAALVHAEPDEGEHAVANAGDALAKPPHPLAVAADRALDVANEQLLVVLPMRVGTAAASKVAWSAPYIVKNQLKRGAPPPSPPPLPQAKATPTRPAPQKAKSRHATPQKAKASPAVGTKRAPETAAEAPLSLWEDEIPRTSAALLVNEVVVRALREDTWMEETERKLSTDATAVDAEAVAQCSARARASAHRTIWPLLSAAAEAVVGVASAIGARRLSTTAPQSAGEASTHIRQLLLSAADANKDTTVRRTKLVAAANALATLLDDALLLVRKRSPVAATAPVADP